MLADSRQLVLSGSGTVPGCSAVGRLATLAPRGLVYIGDRDDAHHRALAARIASEAPHLKLRRIAGPGHYPSLQRPGWLAATVCEVIRLLDR